MPDSEWFEIDPSADDERFTNFESADKAAQEAAQGSAEVVDVVRYTCTVVRRYRRQVTVSAEDLPTT